MSNESFTYRSSHFRSVSVFYYVCTHSGTIEFVNYFLKPVEFSSLDGAELSFHSSSHSNWKISTITINVARDTTIIQYYYEDEKVKVLKVAAMGV